MLLTTRHFRSALLAGALFLPVMITACGHPAYGYRVYDPYYSDYHVWGPGEEVYYNRWVAENHRPHKDFKKLNKDEQRQYFTWRHSQPPAPKAPPAERH
jgi:hypothetical protein